MTRLPPRWRRALPITVVLVAVGVGLLLVAADHWRRGVFVFAFASLLSAVLRWLLPEEAAGPLAVRSRTFDVVFTLALAALLTVLILRS